MAAMLILEPIFEPDMPSEQYAYRHNRSAQDAVRRVHWLLTGGHRHVVDADLAGYFDTIPHAELMKSVARRIVDKRVLRLLRMWLAAPVEERDERGRRKRTTINRDSKQGIPQGSPISPLLSNLYMRRFILGWKLTGAEQRLGAQIVNYADDLVICCKGDNAVRALETMRRMMGQLKLTVNEEKTRTCHSPDEEFDFLGYTFGQRYAAKTKRPYIAAWPSRKSIKRMTEAVRIQTDRNMEWMDAGEMVKCLNQKLGGWANYFKLGPVTKAYRFLDKYTTTRLRRWLCKKHKQSSGGFTRYPDELFHEQMGLICLPQLPQSLPWAKA
jgi:RNA-directed DNA polymerase